jgi:hypothetical protein
MQRPDTTSGDRPVLPRHQLLREGLTRHTQSTHTEPVSESISRAISGVYKIGISEKVRIRGWYGEEPSLSLGTFSKGFFLE